MCCWPAWRCATARWCASATPSATTSSADRRCGTGCRPGCCTRGSSFSAVAPSAGRDAVQAEPGRLAFSEAGFGTGEPVAAAPWDLLGLPEPAHLLRDVMERVGAARAAPAVRQPPPAAGGADADATAQQVAALAERVAELTEQLTRPRPGWMRPRQSWARPRPISVRPRTTSARLGSSAAGAGGAGDPEPGQHAPAQLSSPAPRRRREAGAGIGERQPAAEAQPARRCRSVPGGLRRGCRRTGRTGGQRWHLNGPPSSKARSSRPRTSPAPSTTAARKSPGTNATCTTGVSPKGSS